MLGVPGLSCQDKRSVAVFLAVCSAGDAGQGPELLQNHSPSRFLRRSPCASWAPPCSRVCAGSATGFPPHRTTLPVRAVQVTAAPCFTGQIWSISKNTEDSQSSLASPDGITGGRTAPAPVAPAPTMVAAGCGVLATALGDSIACASGQPLQEVLVAVVLEFLTFSCSSSVTSLTLISVRGCWSSCITLSGIRAPHGSVHAGRVFLWSSQHTPLALGHVYE